MAEIIRCKYAGDPSDEGCKFCDGVKLVENNQTFDEACSFIGIDKLTKEKLINTGLFY